MDSLNAVKIKDNIYWVGVVDWGVRNFHGYSTDKGTTYNAYLIIDEKITLVDAVKQGFYDEFISRISSIIDIKKIDYIISNHSEPDHTGTLPQLIKDINPEKVFASTMGEKTLKEHYGDMGIDVTVVKEDDEISLGKRTMKFMETRMLHWPDSMFSYLVEDKMLFSQDAFGMHLATSERFDDQIPWTILEKYTGDYYANIITLYSPHVAKTFKKLDSAGLDFEYIAPDHGPIWRDMENFGKILKLYQKWSQRKFRKKVVIIYDTMWKSTEIMAKYVEAGVSSEEVEVKVMPLASNDRSQVASEMLDAAAIIVGAPTLNNNVYPSIADVMTYLRGLKFKTPFGAAFGSFGWSGEASKQIEVYIKAMQTEFLGVVKSKYVPDEDAKQECVELGRMVAKKVKEDLNLD